MFLNGNKVIAMTKKSTVPERPAKVRDLTRGTKGMPKNPAAETALKLGQLPKETVSEALGAVLRNQASLAELSNKMEALPSLRMQEAIDQAMRPSQSIRENLASLPSVQLSKAIDDIAAQSAINRANLSKINPVMLKPGLVKRVGASATTFRDVTDLGQAIRAARKKKGLTQQNFADLAGVGRRFLSELEKGKPTLEIGKVMKVASAAGIQLMFKTSGSRDE